MRTLSTLIGQSERLCSTKGIGSRTLFLPSLHFGFIHWYRTSEASVLHNGINETGIRSILFLQPVTQPRTPICPIGRDCVRKEYCTHKPSRTWHVRCKLWFNDSSQKRHVRCVATPFLFFRLTRVNRSKTVQGVVYGVWRLYRTKRMLGLLTFP